MKPKTWQGIAAWLLLLVGVGVAGWFAGIEQLRDCYRSAMNGNKSTPIIEQYAKG